MVREPFASVLCHRILYWSRLGLCNGVVCQHVVLVWCISSLCVGVVYYSAPWHCIFTECIDVTYWYRKLALHISIAYRYNN